MKLKLFVNHATTAEGPFGSFGNLLVSAPGLRADKVVVRTTPQVAEKVAKRIAELNTTKEKILTVEAEMVEAEVGGTVGVREESWTTKAGEAVSQTALYLRFASEPNWALEARRNDLGNLDSL